MWNSPVVKSWSLTLGTIIAAIAVGLLIEFGRSEQVRFADLTTVWCLAAVSYAIPLLWFTWRTKAVDKPRLAWLIVPVLGTILVQLTVIQIPNEIAVWRLSNGSSFLSDLGSVLPMQAFNFLLFFLFYSTISCAIIGLAQIAGLGCNWLRRAFQ
jgi:hypothetical protein